MKKLSNLIGIISMLAMLLAISVPALAAGRQEALYPGETVVLGAYEQDGIKSNGPEDIEWLVLEARGDYALLISQDILDARRYNNQRTEVTWEECTLREWLNGDFYESAFSDEEQDAILTTSVDNSREQGNGGWRRSGGDETEDKVFLLSYAELREYFDTDKEKTCKPTVYAASKGVWMDKNGTSHWWLRSPGSSQYYSAYCSYEGKISSTWNTNDSIGVRPVIRVDLKAVNNDVAPSDSNTKTDVSEDITPPENKPTEELSLEEAKARITRGEDGVYYVDLGEIGAPARLFGWEFNTGFRSEDKIVGFEFFKPVENCIYLEIPAKVVGYDEKGKYDQAQWLSLFRGVEKLEGFETNDVWYSNDASEFHYSDGEFSAVIMDVRNYDDATLTIDAFTVLPVLADNTFVGDYLLAYSTDGICGFRTKADAERFVESIYSDDSFQENEDLQSNEKLSVQSDGVDEKEVKPQNSRLSVAVIIGAVLLAGFFISGGFPFNIWKIWKWK